MFLCFLEKKNYLRDFFPLNSNENTFKNAIRNLISKNKLISKMLLKTYMYQKNNRYFRQITEFLVIFRTVILIALFNK